MIRRVGVLLPLPFDGPLDYLVPPDLDLAPGDYVEVPLGPRSVLGVVWGPGGGHDAARLKVVTRRLDLAAMPAPMRRFIDRAADYTLTPPGLMLRLATRTPELGAAARMQTRYAPGATPNRLSPARARVLAAAGDGPLPQADLARRAGVGVGVVRALAATGALVAVAVARDAPYAALEHLGPGAHLSAAQAQAAATLRSDVGAGFSTTLLHGVTGSGKTEVYLEAVAECVARGRQALVLLPEVALTPAFLARVQARFGARPAEWHHGVTGAERRRCWRAVAAGAAPLVVGARSALFLPFADLGLVVVDEEHDQSYKQDDGVLYHARDMAVLRASLCGAAVVLASATPSLESWANARAGKYRGLSLPDRFGGATLPRIGLIDLRRHDPGQGAWISDPLAQATEARLARGDQVLFFLNRRGYAPLTQCRACGHQFECPDCDAWMVTHRLRGTLMCHQCGRLAPLPTACPGCGRSDRLAVCGPGVERLGEEATARFPGARIEILSSDLADSPAALRDRLAAIADGAADIVIGTQMVAKGHNFPKLTLVGVIDADMGLQGGDLRAAERTFQLLAQVAGRAGRADRPGEALIQTASPDHGVMRAILSGEAEAFWQAEAQARHDAGAPPYGRLAAVIVSGPDEAQVWTVAKALAQGAAMLAGADLLGPAAAPVARIRGNARVRLLVKAPKGLALHPLLRAWLATVRPPGATRVVVDIDPHSFL